MTDFADLLPRKDFLLPIPPSSLPTIISPVAPQPLRAGGGPTALPPYLQGRNPRPPRCPAKQNPSPGGPFPPQPAAPQTPKQLPSSPLSSASHLAFLHPVWPPPRRQLHIRTRVCASPLRPVSCSLLPSTLFKSQLPSCAPKASRPLNLPWVI